MASRDGAELASALSEAPPAPKSRRVTSTMGSLAMARTSQVRNDVVVQCDGRLCKLCGAPVTKDDPVDQALRRVRSDCKNFTMAWYLDNPKHGCKNVGRCCFYCFMTFQSKYKHRQMTCQQLAELNGTSQASGTGNVKPLIRVPSPDSPGTPPPSFSGSRLRRRTSSSRCAGRRA